VNLRKARPDCNISHNLVIHSTVSDAGIILTVMLVAVRN
jgi:hypothetical protein